MRNIHLFFTVFLMIGMLSVQAQKVKNATIVFKNAPVLFKKEGKMFQQIIANIKSEKSTEIVFSIAGKEIQKNTIKMGSNMILLTISAVSSSKKIIVAVKGDNDLDGNYPLTITPVKKWEVYMVQHSHTDIGYTRPQSEILAEHLRYIDYALDYCDQTDGLPDDSKFRWTCESAWVTREYLRSRPSSQIERLKKRIAEGRIEVTGMYVNMAEISDENIMYDFLQPLKEFSKLGIPVKTAMQNDVNGIAWCMPDYFKNTGVKYLNMGINPTRSIRPFDKPTCFWWEAPSGERMLAFRANTYHDGNIYGLVNKSPDFPANILWHLADLESKDYPFDRIAIQFSGYYIDNAPPSTAACERVKLWNEKYEYPKIRLSVASEFFEYVEKNYADKLPVFRSAWLDWWTDGYGSTSRETAEVRKAQNMKQVDEGMFAMVSMLGGKTNPALEEKIDHISENAIFFDEHTCGANESINHPFSENSTRQWLQKGAYAWEALKKVTLLNEEALARLQEFMKKSDFPLIYVINSLGWERSGSVELFIDYEVLPLHNQFKITDIFTGKEVKAQVVRERREGAYWVLDVSNVPALGYKALKIEVSNEPDTKANDNLITEILENAYYKIVIDKSTGALSSLIDKELNQEIVDSQNPWKLGQLIRETLPDRRKMIPSHSSVSNVKVEHGTNGSVWESIRIAADMDGFEKGKENAPKGLELEIRLFKNVKKIDFQYKATKEIVTSPEALFVAFPFSLPKSRIVFETIGGILTQGQQLPGSSSDWNAAQNFVSVRGTSGQIVVVSNEIPLWQFSDFNMGKFERYTKPGKPWLYSWVMNNYWWTNFRAFQEGGFSWSYQITSTADTTNSFATKYAWSQRNPFPTRTIPAGANELKSPYMETLKIIGPANAMLINSRPAFKGKGTILLHFRELEGLPAEVKLSSAVPNRSIKRMVEVNAVGRQIGQPVNSIQLNPHEVKFVEVEF